MLSCCCVQVADGERRSSWGKRVEAAWRSTPKALFSVSLCPNSAVSGQGHKYLRYPETLKYFKSTTNMTQNIMFSDDQSSTDSVFVWTNDGHFEVRQVGPPPPEPEILRASARLGTWMPRMPGKRRPLPIPAGQGRQGRQGQCDGDFWVIFFMTFGWFLVIWRFWMDLYLLFLDFSWLLLFVCGDFKVLDGLDGDLKYIKGFGWWYLLELQDVSSININKWEYQPANRGQEKRTFPVSSKEGYRNGTRLVGTWNWDCARECWLSIWWVSW